MENQTGTSRPPGGNKNNMLEQTQAKVIEVHKIMIDNVNKARERDHKIIELKTRADQLEKDSKRFERLAQLLKRKYWWKNSRMMIIMGVIGLVILIIIIVSVTYSGSSSTNSKKTTTPST